MFRIGRKDSNRVRPLLVCFTSEESKLAVLSNAPRLRFHDIYKKVFIAPDMTRFERAKHKKLVEELKQRRQQGETNLIIKNVSIVQRQLRRSNTSNVNIFVPVSAQSSSTAQTSPTIMSTDVDSRGS